MDYKVISFYKYYNVKDPIELKNYIKGLCTGLDLLGRILIAKEGINAAICGKTSNIEKFKRKIKDIRRLKDLTFREQYYDKQAYHKLVVRVRNEIVNFGLNIDMKKKGNYIAPKELKKIMDNKEDIILVDVRNDYEHKIGRFKGAIRLPIESFREFPKKSNSLDKYKNKKIIMYCTGGIRCEKATAYLKSKEFKDVNHIQGGIINYVNKYPNTHFEGSCFVFDDRLVNKNNSDVLSDCLICGNKSDEYINCHNMDCDKLFISCRECQEKYNMNCSTLCMNSKRQRPRLMINDII